MASGWSAPWGGAGGDQWSPWGEEPQWAPPTPKGKGKKGFGKKGKGKVPTGDDTHPAEVVEHTGRILSRYQFPKAVLRNSIDQESSALQKEKTKMNDFNFLAHKNLKKLVTPQNHHLLRRPGVGISEAAGTLKVGTDMLGQMENLDIEPLTAALGKDAVQEALQVLNTMDATVERPRDELVKALSVLEKTFAETPAMEESAIKLTVMASRLYLLGMHLLPLLAGLSDPQWWGSQVPESLSSSKKFQAWKADPGDRKKMKAALATLLCEKIEEASGAGNNDAANLFGRTLSKGAPGGSSESASSHKKYKKTDKKEKKKKAKKSSSGPSSSTTEKKKKTKKRDAKKKKAKKDSSDESSRSKQENVSSAPDVIAEKAEKRGKEPKEKEGKRKREGKAETATEGGQPVVKVRRVSGTTSDGRVTVREDDRFDEVVVKSTEWTLAEMLQDLFAASGQAEDLKNWTVKILEDGKCKPVALDTTPAALHHEVVLIKKGG